MAKKIIVEPLHDGQVIRVTLNAPKANILDAEMMADIQEFLDVLPMQSEVKMIQFTGAGDHFCFGASVPEHVREKAPEMLKHFHKLFYTLADLAIPTAALVTGQCLGGGMELALMCNFLFVEKTATLGQPEICLGVIAPPASIMLPMKVGQANADELLISGKTISGCDALGIGLVTELYEDRDTMLSEVDAWVKDQILPKSASSLRYAVKAARREFNETLRAQLRAVEKMYLEELMATHDANEGIASFMERRKPDWKNS
jgi:cyclohexa-1,5-dienecarbonyl-CoA hydratase